MIRFFELKDGLKLVRLEDADGLIKVIQSTLEQERDARQELLEKTFGHSCLDCACFDKGESICKHSETIGYICPTKGRRDDCPFLKFEVKHDSPT